MVRLGASILYTQENLYSVETLFSGLGLLYMAKKKWSKTLSACPSGGSTCKDH
ncbi:unnamed protein product [Brassica rapa]|uniref:Uncharacterized protein n=2 Tax=Brassica TaxID=3705 RepID=A0A3P5ZH65_BRACM|nr:unnamed protein product [Brassica rapa]VDC75635.1 unnamed protein product [Brassica rapa]VDD50320.1 unnamed protein product [Brassica oleracea]